MWILTMPGDLAIQQLHRGAACLKNRHLSLQVIPRALLITCMFEAQVSWESWWHFIVFVESRRFMTDAADHRQFKKKRKRQAEVGTMLSVSSHFFRSLHRIKCKIEWLCSKNMSYSYMVKDTVNSKKHRRKVWKSSLSLHLGNERDGGREYCH